MDSTIILLAGHNMIVATTIMFETSFSYKTHPFTQSHSYQLLLLTEQ